MFDTLKRFFAFCREENRKKLYKSIVLGVVKAIFEAMKIPAIALMMSGVLDGNVTMVHILGSLGIMLVSVAGNAIISYKSVMLQCEAGYGTCADKRIEIAEHLKYLPMGYFNQNSLGYITSVATNTMEALADVATRVVMLVTQGILNYLPLFIDREGYFATREKFGQEYVDTLGNIMQNWMIPVLIIASFVFGILGALLGKSLLKKHFVKAGIV